MDKNGRQFTLSKGSVKTIGHEFTDRITDDAVLRVLAHEEERIKKVFRLAEIMAKHAGRKTIKEEDIRLVLMMEDEL